MHKRVIIIMGVQRSGTTALFETLATDLGLTAYHEHPDNALYYDYYLRPEPEIRAILQAAPGAVLLKPVKESNKRGVEAVFEEYAAYDLRIVWLYRDPVNVIHSWVCKGWTTQANAIPVALEWVARNQAMLEVMAAFQDRLIIVRYEDLLQEAAVLERLKSSLGLTGQSTLRTDSNAGRTNVPERLQALIDQITGRTLALLDQARTLRPGAADDQGSSSSLAALWQRLGVPRRRTPSTPPLQPPAAMLPQPGAEGFLIQPDLYTPAYSRDPYACFRLWRQQGAVVSLPTPQSRLALGYDAVACAAQKRDHFTAPPNLPSDANDNTAWEPALKAFLAPQNYRQQLARMESSIHTLITTQQEGGAFDWIEVCRRWTPRLFAGLLGVLPGCSEAFYKLVNQQVPLETLRATLDEKGLLAKWIDGGEECRHSLSEFIFMVSIFQHLISQFLGNSLYQLLLQPEGAAGIRQQPERIPALLTELLRLSPPVLNVLRVVRCEVEIADTTLPTGSFVYLSLGAANRDPSRFEQPDALRLDRSLPPLLPFAFAADSYQRLGEHTMRVIGEAVLRVLLTEFPPLEPVQPLSSIPWKHSAFTISGPEALPVKFAQGKRSASA